MRGGETAGALDGGVTVAAGDVVEEGEQARDEDHQDPSRGAAQELGFGLQRVTSHVYEVINIVGNVDGVFELLPVVASLVLCCVGICVGDSTITKEHASAHACRLRVVVRGATRWSYVYSFFICFWALL